MSGDRFGDRPPFFPKHQLAGTVSAIGAGAIHEFAERACLQGPWITCAVATIVFWLLLGALLLILARMFIIAVIGLVEGIRGDSNDV